MNFLIPCKSGLALGVIVVHKYLEGMMCFSGTEVWDHNESMMCLVELKFGITRERKHLMAHSFQLVINNYFFDQF